MTPTAFENGRKEGEGLKMFTFLTLVLFRFVAKVYPWQK